MSDESSELARPEGTGELVDLKTKLRDIDQKVNALLLAGAEPLPAGQEPLIGLPSVLDDRMLLMTQARTAPVPSPQEVREYESIRPGLGIQILDDHHQEMVERTKEHEHRRNLERDDQTFAHRYMHRSQNITNWSLAIATALALVALGLAAYMTYKGAFTQAAAVIVTGVAAIVGSIWFGGRKHSEQIPDSRAKSKDA